MCMITGMCVFPGDRPCWLLDFHQLKMDICTSADFGEKRRKKITDEESNYCTSGLVQTGLGKRKKKTWSLHLTCSCCLPHSCSLAGCKRLFGCSCSNESCKRVMCCKIAYDCVQVPGNELHPVILYITETLIIPLQLSGNKCNLYGNAHCLVTTG